MAKLNCNKSKKRSVFRKKKQKRYSYTVFLELCSWVPISWPLGRSLKCQFDSTIRISLPSAKGRKSLQKTMQATRLIELHAHFYDQSNAIWRWHKFACKHSDYAVSGFRCNDATGSYLAHNIDVRSSVNRTAINLRSYLHDGQVDTQPSVSEGVFWHCELANHVNW